MMLGCLRSSRCKGRTAGIGADSTRAAHKSMHCTGHLRPATRNTSIKCRLQLGPAAAWGRRPADGCLLASWLCEVLQTHVARSSALLNLNGHALHMPRAFTCCLLHCNPAGLHSVHQGLLHAFSLQQTCRQGVACSKQLSLMPCCLALLLPLRLLWLLFLLLSRGLWL